MRRRTPSRWKPKRSYIRIAGRLLVNTSNSTRSSPRSGAPWIAADTSRDPIPRPRYSGCTPMPSRPTCRNPSRSSGRMSHQPTTPCSTGRISSMATHCRGPRLDVSANELANLFQGGRLDHRQVLPFARNPIQHGVEARHVFFGNRHDIDAQFHSLCPLVLRPRVSREHQVKRRTIQSPNLGESWPSATRIRIYGG